MPVRSRTQLDLAIDALAEHDPRLAALIDASERCDLGLAARAGSHFGELVRTVCYQQLAGRAAATIHGRFVRELGGRVRPEVVLALPDEAFRRAGLSRAKQASILDLAERVDDGRVNLARVARLDDPLVVEQLSAVRGIGRWTAEMFLMFRLGRLDVWPTGDLGVRRGFARVFDLPSDPTPRQLELLGEPFRPHRSVLAWYCWRAVDQVS